MEDIPALGHYFISRFNQEVGTAVTGLSNKALEVLMSYHWPGNVRELKSTIERACLEAKMGLIRPENLYYITDRLGHQGDDLKGQSLKQITDQAQKAAIIKALEMAGGNRKLACEILKVNRTTFYAKLKEFGLQ
jgi:two-component system response regulator AtoC